MPRDTDTQVLSIPGTRPEDELILRSASVHTDQGAAERIRLLLRRQEPDWNYLLRSAQKHGALGLLYRGLVSSGAHSLPRSWMRSLGSYCARSAARRRYLADELLRILDVLEGNGIAAVPFRGAAQAACCSDELAYQDFNDISLLLHEQQMVKARWLLSKEGYKPVFTLRTGQEAAQIHFHCEYRLYRTKDRVRVRLHWQLDPGSYTRPMDFARLQKRFQKVSLDGHNIYTLSPADILLDLSASIVQRFPRRIGRLADICALIGRHREFDWAAVDQRVHQHGGTRRLHVGLRLAMDLFGATLPPPVRTEVHADREAFALAAQIQKELFGGNGSPPGILENCRWQLRTREGLRDKARCVLNLAFTPTEGDWGFVPLPASLFPLYVLVRPVRLAGRYLGLWPPGELAEFGATPHEIARQMLVMARVGPADVVYDLGCGDGRIVITAAKEFGAKGVGIDIDPARIAEATAGAREHGVQHLVNFSRQNVMSVDTSPATVVVLYVGATTNILLRDKLQAELRAGTRIISYDYDMGDWAPVTTELAPHDEGVGQLYLWRIDGKAAAWRA